MIQHLVNEAGGRFNDWIVTVSFYTALHITEYLISRGENIDCVHEGLSFTIEKPKNIHQIKDYLADRGWLSRSDSPHTVRSFLVNAADQFQKINKHYRYLEREARASRYKNFNVYDLTIQSETLPKCNEFITTVNAEFGEDFQSVTL